MCAKIPNVEKITTKSRPIFTKSDLNRPNSNSLSPPDPNYIPSCDVLPSESTIEVVQTGSIKSIVRFPDPKNKPKIGDGFSDAKCEKKQRRKVKIKERKFSESGLTPITNFFRKKNEKACIIDSPGKRKQTEVFDKESKKLRLGTDYKMGSET